MDRYDQEVAYLKAHLTEIYEAWNDLYEHRSGRLFAFTQKENPLNCVCYCLTQIRSYSDYEQYTELSGDLLKEIRNDKRIPESMFMKDYDEDGDPLNLMKFPLELFAEYQRKIDEALRREPPPLFENDSRFNDPTVSDSRT